MSLYPPESRSPTLKHAWLTVAPPTREEEAIDQTFGRSAWAVCTRCGVVGKRDQHKASCTVGR